MHAPGSIADPVVQPFACANGDCCPCPAADLEANASADTRTDSSCDTKTDAHSHARTAVAEPARYPRFKDGP
jgi:hypothetical protein